MIKIISRLLTDKDTMLAFGISMIIATLFIALTYKLGITLYI